jgi:hypothetical protein
VHNIDKKKSELYFYFSVKKILTKKANRACPKQQSFSDCIHFAMPPVVTGIFFAPMNC